MLKKILTLALVSIWLVTSTTYWADFCDVSWATIWKINNIECLTPILDESEFTYENICTKWVITDEWWVLYSTENPDNPWKCWNTIEGVGTTFTFTYSLGNNPPNPITDSWLITYNVWSWWGLVDTLQVNLTSLQEYDWSNAILDNVDEIADDSLWIITEAQSTDYFSIIIAFVWIFVLFILIAVFGKAFKSKK